MQNGKATLQDTLAISYKMQSSREGLGRRHRRPGGEKGESKGRESSDIWQN